MRSIKPTFLFLVAFAVCCLGDQARAEPAAGRPVAKGLVMHEWGVFTVANDVALANADMRAEWDGLPKFVHGQLKGRDFPRTVDNPQLMDVSKPVLFFHCPQEAEVDLKVDFPGGMPAVWWPGTRSSAVNWPRRTLDWHLHLKDAPKKDEPAAGQRAVDGGHWMSTLRVVKADDVFAVVGEAPDDVPRGRAAPFYEREKFVYYDGLVPRGKWVEIAVAGDKVSVNNRAKHPVFDLTVVDRRSAHVRVARLARLDAQAKVPALEFREADKTDWPAAGVRTLQKQLQDAGLNEDEGRSLIDIWKKELLQADGVTLFCRLPQEEYERLLPLTLTPGAEKLVRVGLVLQPHCEPDLADRVARLVRDLDNDDFQTRERAQKQLGDMGRAGFVHLRRLYQETKAPEVRQRLERLLEKVDAERALRP